MIRTPIKPQSRTPRLDRFIHLLALAFTGFLLVVSPMALTMVGWNYDSLGGAAFMRFHPATYTMLLLFVVVALRDGNPLASVFSAFAHDLLVFAFLIMWIVMLVHGTRNQELPAAGLVDTFLLPVLTLLMFRRLEPETLGRMRWIVHVAFAANAVIGMGEVASGLRLTPYVAGGVAIGDDWRATALFGHPLGNALATGCYATILLLGGAKELTGWPRRITLILQFGGMAAFGGRASLVLLVLAGSIALCLSVMHLLAGKRVALRDAAIVAIGLPMLLGGVALAYEFGAFDRLILRFVSDGGSAKARIIMFELFNDFTLAELLFGPPQSQLAHLVNIYRLEFGIESLWIAFSLYYGIVPTILFFSGLLLFLVSLTRSCQTRAWIVLGYFFVVNSTFLGLAGKTIGFTTLCLLLLLLLPTQQRLALPRASMRIAPTYRGTAPC